MFSAEPVFRGAGVALVTLFDDSGTPDVTATVAHAVAVVERGVRGVLLAGTVPELSVTAFAGDAAAERRLAPVERFAWSGFRWGSRRSCHEQAGTSTAFGRGTAELLERSA